LVSAGDFLAFIRNIFWPLMPAFSSFSFVSRSMKYKTDITIFVFRRHVLFIPIFSSEQALHDDCH
jgi:hypothetical protein